MVGSPNADPEFRRRAEAGELSPAPTPTPVESLIAEAEMAVKWAEAENDHIQPHIVAALVRLARAQHEALAPFAAEAATYDPEERDGDACLWWDLSKLNVRALRVARLAHEGIDPEVACKARGWLWDEGGPQFYRNRPGASPFEPYEYERNQPITGTEMTTRQPDWQALYDRRIRFGNPE